MKASQNVREVPRSILCDLGKEEHGIWGDTKANISREPCKSERVKLSKVVSRCFESFFTVNYIMGKLSLFGCQCFFLSWITIFK